MYDPKGNGVEKAVQTVLFSEAEPPAHLRNIVHRFLEVKTDGILAEDYRFHALPDACTYVVFDQTNQDVSGIAKLQASSEELNLGKSFHFVNIRFLPGVWQGNKEDIVLGMVDAPYSGELPLLDINRKITSKPFTEQQTILSKLVEDLIARGLVIENPLTHKIFEHIFDIHTVADMAHISGLSARQLQRTLKQTTGFSPHDFLKVLRLQQALNGTDAISYADQSHFIHSFRKATGYTPGKYAKKFDV
jgi:AraC-like DNA-binding protein